MNACPQHRHEHRQLPCPWPDCPNAQGATDTTEVPRHTGAGRMTRGEGHFQTAPAPRVFQRTQWRCDACGASGWTWLEAGAELRMDRCPHRRTSTVQPRSRAPRP